MSSTDWHVAQVNIALPRAPLDEGSARPFRMKQRVLALVPVVVLLGLFVPPAQAAQNGQFVLRCGYSHSLPDDPIVFPG